MIESNQRLLSEITARAVDEGVTLPFDVTRPAEGFISRELVIKPLPAEMMEAVRELAARHRVDTDSVYRAAFAAVLFRYSGSDRIDLWHDRTDGNLAAHELHRTADTRFTDILTQAPPRPWRAGEDRDIELLVVDSAHPRPREIFATRHVRLALVPPADRKSVV